MRKKMRKQIIGAALALAVLTLCVDSSSLSTGATSKDDVNDAEQEAEEAQQRVDELKSELNSLKNSISSVSDYIAELDKQYSDYTWQLNNTQTAIEAKQAEIDAKQIEIDVKKAEIADMKIAIAGSEAELADAQAEQDAQYEAMKLRIQYMYECGDQTFLDLIFSAEDLSDLLGKTEYVNSITGYDREQLEKMMENKEMISDLLAEQQVQQTELEEAEAELEVELAGLEYEESELLSMKTQLTNEQAYVDTVLQQKEATLAGLEGQQSSTSDALAMAEKEAEEQKAFAAQVKKLYEQEQAAAKAQGIDASEAARQTLASIYANGGFTWPLPGYTYITSPYGYRIHPIAGIWALHDGTDISGSGVNGKPIVAAYSGTVILSQYYSGFGNSVQISHGPGVVTQYSHCSSLAVSVGEYVEAGQVIAYVGATGNATGPHLHFSMYIEGQSVDAMDYVSMP